MAKMTIAEVERMLAQTIRRVRDERERVTRTDNGERVVAIMTAEAWGSPKNSRTESTSRGRASRSPNEGDPIPFEKIRGEFGPA